MKRRRIAEIGTALVVLGVAVGSGVLWGERRGMRDAQRSGPAEPAVKPRAPSAMPVPGAVSDKESAAQEEAVEVTLPPEAIERAGIKTAVVQAGQGSAALTVPGTVTSNAYRDTKVNALVGGVVRQVAAELGAPVSRDQPLAVIFSAELAEAQMKYLSMRAMLTADHQKLERTHKLVELGAASRQELEEVVAVHSAHESELAAAQQRLLLLGLPEDHIARITDASHVLSEVTVRAPSGGVVVARSVNPGQIVGAGHELFVVTDLTTVWVVGDLYEKDVPLVRVGTPVAITLAAAPQTPRRGRVSYLDPRVDPATRTAKVRVEVPNPDQALRLGMFVTLHFQSGAGQRVMLVPRAAVQAVGERTVVYVAADDAEGRFTERAVKLGPAAGEFVQVVEGLRPGERVVTEGSFFLRAEAARTRSGG
jgi:cobalt-zinc-cadmium efflux system membrane fusion protein